MKSGTTLFPPITKQTVLCLRGVQVVRKVAYDAASDTSVVECTPVHGRTHQIRLHLQVSERYFIRNAPAPVRARCISSVVVCWAFVLGTCLVYAQAKRVCRCRRLCLAITASFFVGEAALSLP